MTERREPLRLEACPLVLLPGVVVNALAELTLGERVELGTLLPMAVGVLSEAQARGVSAESLEGLLTDDELDRLARLVEPHLWHTYETEPQGAERYLN